MNVLILGSGGRESAFAWKLNQSPICNRLFVAPGNGGCGAFASCVDLDISNFKQIKNFAIEKEINIILVGPEAPLVHGIYDYFSDTAIKVFGPSQSAAQLEGSKTFAKEFMAQYNIPTAAYKSFNQSQLAEGLTYLESVNMPIVLKADGLAAGKGVLIIETLAEAKAALKSMLNGQFGEASKQVVVEEFLSGIEFSVFAITNGDHYKILPIAKDYKRIGEGDTGLNTGGMGAISPVPFVDSALMQKVQDRIIKPTIDGIKNRKMDYYGFVFFGLIKVGDDPYVIEYNCRMGDPETEAVLPRLKNDLLDLIRQAQNHTLSDANIEIDTRFATTIMLVSGGYPEAYQKGKVIKKAAAVKNSLLFQAGTKIENNQLITNGGRVIAITSFGDNLAEALAKSKASAQIIDYEGKYFRNDLGFDLN